MLKTFLLFLCLPLFAQAPRRIQVLPNPQKLEDFDHPVKGCPENSECDEVMGSMLARWSDLIGKLSDEKFEKAKIPNMLEAFRQKYGLPVDFYTYQVSQLGFKPLLYNSPCKEHNPKETEKRTLKGEAFLKSLSLEKAVVQRAETVMEVPTKDSLVVGQPVHVIGGLKYILPLEDQPLFIKDKELIVLREVEGLYYALKVSTTGEWKVIPLDQTNLSQWEDKRETVTCPIEKVATPHPKEFNLEFCKNIWDEDQKKTVIVRMYQGCAI